MNLSTATLDLRRDPAPLWTAAVLSLLLHTALLAALGSALTSAWRGGDFTVAPGSGVPLQATLAPRVADAVSEPPPLEPALEVAPAAPPPAAPLAPVAPPGLTQPGAGNAGVPRRPPPPPADVGDIAVGATTHLAAFGPAIAARLAQQFPVTPGRLPRLLRSLTVVYPEWALRDRRSARIEVLLLLDEKGTVLETVLEPNDPVFGPAVRDALAGAVFLPAKAADTALPYWIALEFVFAIDPVKPTAAKAN
jgi:hypothetical protein